MMMMMMMMMKERMMMMMMIIATRDGGGDDGDGDGDGSVGMAVLGAAEKYKESTFIWTLGRIVPSSIRDIAAEISQNSSQVSADTAPDDSPATHYKLVLRDDKVEIIQ
jgi:hypothetical protein